jgi:hypothetical protein
VAVTEGFLLTLLTAEHVYLLVASNSSDPRAKTVLVRLVGGQVLDGLAHDRLYAVLQGGTHARIDIGGNPLKFSTPMLASMGRRGQGGIPSVWVGGVVWSGFILACSLQKVVGTLIRAPFAAPALAHRKLSRQLHVYLLTDTIRRTP